MTNVNEETPPLLGIMAVVCTDRGQHKRTRLGDVRWYADGWRVTWPASSRHQSFLPPENKEGANSNYIFDCPRCTRTPYFSRAKWLELIEGRFHPRNWGVGDRAEFDVSLIPF
ncbi:hypothetical protein BKA19_2413 [Blastococcus saxobsidens]|uniref:Uncharacterized protein n=1 Tax=Blastococcus saxobsidens TaxID=138336 RepID=A0A4Q7Y994_9ACTN|nr:hypothetical protein BKA19_2413 [Blastococcus saxobsidens]